MQIQIQQLSAPRPIARPLAGGLENVVAALLALTTTTTTRKSESLPRSLLPSESKLTPHDYYPPFISVAPAPVPAPSAGNESDDSNNGSDTNNHSKYTQHSHSAFYTQPVHTTQADEYSIIFHSRQRSSYRPTSDGQPPPSPPDLWPEYSHSTVPRAHTMAAPGPENLIDTTPWPAAYRYADNTPPYHTSAPHNYASESLVEDYWDHESVHSFQPQPHIRNTEHSSARASALEGTHVCHEGDITALTSCEMMSCLSRHDEVLLDEATFTDSNNPLGLHLYYHTRHYLEPVTINDPLVHIRFVFAAHQLPRGDKFSDLVGPIRIKHTIDAYLIPHESKPVDHDQDVVLGLSGTLGRVCSGLRNLLQIMVPDPEGFSFWRLDLLVQRILKHRFVDEYDDPGDSASTVAPCLREAMGFWYGPIPSANDESILTLQSCSLDTIMNAVNYVGQVFVQEETALEPCKNFYCGGRPSILPVLTILHPDVRRMVAQMDRRVPAGYIFRPEMQTCLKSMQRKRYHLQVLLDTANTMLFLEPIGESLRRSCESIGAALNISDRTVSEGDAFRVCDIGADELQSLEESIVEIVSWKATIACGDWSVMLYIPERVVLKLKTGTMEDDQEHLGFVHRMKPLQEIEGLIKRCDIRLEPAEKESILWIKSSNSAIGIENAVSAVVATIYR